MDQIRCQPAAPSRTSDDSDNARRQASLSWKAVKTAVGQRYEKCSLENFQADDQPRRESLQVLRQFVAGVGDHVRKGRGLILMGPKGTGKDHLAIACLRHAAQDAHATVAWVDGQTLFQRFRDLIDSEGRESEAIAQWTRPDVLLISDPMPQFGAPSDHQRSILWRIIDRRYRDLKPTWATLNIASREEGETKLGPQLMDRLCDGARVVQCRWPSYRKVMGGGE